MSGFLQTRNYFTGARAAAAVFLLCCCPMTRSHADPVAMPDVALETAVEHIIGDNGIPGTVDGNWLLGENGAAGPYEGPPGGLTILGRDDQGAFHLAGVADLTGLEAAARLRGLVLINSAPASLLPIVRLPQLLALAFFECEVSEELLDAILQGTLNLRLFAAAYYTLDRDSPVSSQFLQGFLQRFPDLRDLNLHALGAEFDLSWLEDTALGTPWEMDTGLNLSRNRLTGDMRLLNRFSELNSLELAGCGISDAMLQATDWSRMQGLSDVLDLSENGITDIAPLLGLIRRPDATGTSLEIRLHKNPLNETSIREHIPQLEAQGFKVEWGYPLVVEIEGTGTVDPEPGLHSFPPGWSLLLQAGPLPDSGQGFLEWQGDIASADSTVPITINGPMRVRAVFTEAPTDRRALHSVLITQAGPGIMQTQPAPGKYWYPGGHHLSITAYSGDLGFFGGWNVIPMRGDPAQPGIEGRIYQPSFALTVNEDVIVAAWAASRGFPVTLEVSGKGTLSPLPDRHTFAEGMQLRVAPFPDTGWRLRHWENGNGEILAVPEPTALDTSLRLTVDQPHVIRAVFEEAKRALTLRREEATSSEGVTEPPSEPSGIAHTYDFGQEITLIARPANANSAFAGWSGDLPGLRVMNPAESLLRVVMTEDYHLCAHFVPAEINITIGATDTTGPIDPAALLEPPAGTYGFIRCPEMTFTVSAAPLPGNSHAFLRWEGDLPDGAAANDPALILPVDRDRFVNAIFTRQGTRTLTLKNSDASKGRIAPPPGAYVFIPGNRFPVTAIPESNAYFGSWHILNLPAQKESWRLDDAFASLPDADLCVTATWGDEPATLNVETIDPNAVLSPPIGKHTVAQGTTVTLGAEPTPGRYFHHWTDARERILSESPEYAITLDADTSARAIFGPPRYKARTACGGAGKGRVETDRPATEWYLRGEVAHLTAMPESDSVFSGWHGDLPPDVDIRNPEIRLRMDRDRNVTANFDPADHQLTIMVDAPEAACLLTPPPGVYGMRHGEEMSLRAYPAPGSPLVFLRWHGSRESDHPEITVVADGDLAMTAAFEPAAMHECVQLTVTPPEGYGQGRISPLGPGVYFMRKGTRLVFSAVLDSEAYFGGWTGDAAGEILPEGLELALNHDKSVGARFTDHGGVVNIRVEGEEGGTVSPPPGLYRFSDDMPIPLRASVIKTGWTFHEWRDGAGERLGRAGAHTAYAPSDGQQLTLIAVFRKAEEGAPMELCQSREPTRRARGFPRSLP